MKPDPKFSNLPKYFWANVRSISQAAGYVARTKIIEAKRVKIYSPLDIRNAFKKMKLSPDHILTTDNEFTELGQLLNDYFVYRANILNNSVSQYLMNLVEVRELFDDLYNQYRPQCHIPMNKQKGEKKGPAYFTGIINMLMEANIGGLPIDLNPRTITTITYDGKPLRTLSRRLDGAFPNTVNPLAIWEIKEYYFTKTFGSRVADGVYETLLDGMEIEELRISEKRDVLHYLMIDDHFTWWVSGRPYLCRIIDMLNMGYVDEVLFGREVVERLPEIVSEWVNIYTREQGS